MIFPDLPLGQLVTLRAGGSELVCAPECGARLLAFRVQGRDVKLLDRVALQQLVDATLQ